MGQLQDIQDLIDKVRSTKNSIEDNLPKSIVKGAQSGTLQYPCLISDSIAVDMASTIAKTMERVYASFIQTYLSTHNTVDISVDKNPNSFLKKFHRNIKLESSVLDLYKENCTEPDEEYDKLMERIYDGTTEAFINEKTNEMIVFNFSEKFPKEVYESHKAGLVESLKDIDFTPICNIGNSPYYEAIVQDEFDTSTAITRANFPVNIAGNAINAGINHFANRNMEKLKQKNAIAMQGIKAKDDLEKERFKIQQASRVGGISVPTLMKDNDIKKVNDMQPYMMQVRLMAINSHNEFVQFMDFVIGIKVVLHLIKSDEMIMNLQHTVENRSSKLFNLIRWTTGEKSLFKDIILGLNDTKLDAANKSRGVSPWWSTLKRLKNTVTPRNLLFRSRGVVPQSTIVISQYEVDAIKERFGYDLANPKFGVRLMNALFLMCFIIVDEGTRTVNILYDGENYYQTYALETLEREVTMSSNKIGKELTRMISR